MARAGVKSEQLEGAPPPCCQRQEQQGINFDDFTYYRCWFYHWLPCYTQKSRTNDSILGALRAQHRVHVILTVRVRIIIEVCRKVSTKGNITLACSRIKKAAAYGYVFLSAFLKIFFAAEANAHLVKFMGHEMDGINNHRVSSNVLLHQTGQGMCDGELEGD